ncbi:hypothetical protein MHYP_G00244270 [Metynnis hypsauchen]
MTWMDDKILDVLLWPKHSLLQGLQQPLLRRKWPEVPQHQLTLQLQAREWRWVLRIADMQGLCPSLKEGKEGTRLTKSRILSQPGDSE